MREIEGDRDTQLGQRQVDVYAGLNVMILLLELHRYAQEKESLKAVIDFYPCGRKGEKKFDFYRLHRIIDYSGCISTYTFRDLMKHALSYIKLSGVAIYTNLVGADFSNADLSDADLRTGYFVQANFQGANLSGANLQSADLTGANLSRANLNGAKLSDRVVVYGSLVKGTTVNLRKDGANLNQANLQDITWDQNTQWRSAQGLETAVNIPEELRRQLGIVENDE
jgi:hypothetical protein